MSDAPPAWRPTTAQWVALTLAALLLAGVAIRGAVQAVLRQRAPGVTMLWPANARALAARAQARLASAGTIDAPARALYRAALIRGPLLAEPLALAATDDSGDAARAERLMAAARARNPRLLNVRVWLLDRYVRTGRLDAALVEAGVIARLDPRALPPLLDVMGAMATTPAGQAALVRALRRQPLWRTAFFLAVSRGLSDPAILLALQQAAPPAPGARADTERRVVQEAMIAAGDGERAYAAWRRALPPGFTPPATIVYDGGFTGLPGAAPFNWTLTDTTAGSARRAPGGRGLAVEAAVARRTLLALQTIRLPAGDYRLTVTAQRSGPAGVAGLEAQLLCIDSGDMARLPLADLPARPTGYSLPVRIGAECPIARLRLVAMPAPGGAPLRALVSTVAITPAA